jgi:beta-glucosidase
MKKWHLEEKDGYCLIYNEGGRTLGFSKESGVKILEVDGYAFKDLDGDGVLDPYEDWRLPMEERVKDLVSRMSIEQIAGLMLYSSHQSVQKPGEDLFAKRFAGTYGGKSFEESGADISDLTDQQIQFITQDNVRHVLLTKVETNQVAARWSNHIQALAESMDLGIPVNISSDPRHGTESNGEFIAGGSGTISKWPSGLGLAATFDPDIVENFGRIAAEEYRALGIATALSPQIDLATEPRWMRYNGTFGEGTKLSTDMARAYCDGFQTSTGEAELENGWGLHSVNAMAKHWPGGGAGEGGRDAHFSYGKFAVYPGKNFDEAMKPFTEGAFQLNGPTGKTAAIMPYYTISYEQDKKYGENVGNSYSKYIIHDLLREKYGYDGVVCTDWGITADNHSLDDFGHTCWGTEYLTVAERHYKAIMAGVDQFGGNNDKAPVLTAYEMGKAVYGEEAMTERFRQSATRLLRNFFRTGLFENPYLDPDATAATVGKPEFMAAGFDAQCKSLVMLKNKDQILPMKRCKVYIPHRHVPAGKGFMGARAIDEPGAPRELVEKYFDIADTPQEADFAIVFMDSPKSLGYDPESGYLPITLQYRPYKADTARRESIAGADPWSEDPNRSYYGKENVASNSCELDSLIATREAMGDKPVIVSLNMSNPTVPAEFEPLADAIIVNFSAQTQAVLELIAGHFEPSGLLPCQLPADMLTVEAQYEDVPRDMICYTDACGNTYDFAFGLNWKGVINDERVAKYK